MALAAPVQVVFTGPADIVFSNPADDPGQD